MELNQTKMMDKIDAFITSAGTPATPLEADAPLTVGNYEQLRNQEKTEKLKSDNQYGKDYMVRIQELAVDEEDHDLHLQIEAMITDEKSEFNTRSNPNPGTAATINYYKAKAHIQSGKADPNPIKLKGDKKLPPKGDPSKTVEKTEPEVTLTADEQEYIKKRGITPERYKKIMADKTPVYSTQGQVI